MMAITLGPDDGILPTSAYTFAETHMATGMMLGSTSDHCHSRPTRNARHDIGLSIHVMSITHSILMLPHDY